MNVWDIVLLVLLLLMVVLAIRSIRRNAGEGNGCFSCGGDCRSCSGCGGASDRKQKNNLQEPVRSRENGSDSRNGRIG